LVQVPNGTEKQTLPQALGSQGAKVLLWI